MKVQELSEKQIEALLNWELSFTVLFLSCWTSAVGNYLAWLATSVSPSSFRESICLAPRAQCATNHLTYCAAHRRYRVLCTEWFGQYYR